MGEFVLTVKTLAGKKIEFDVMASDTIGAVKIKICERAAVLSGGVRTSKMNLFRLFGVGVFEDEHTLSYYKIGETQTIGVLFKSSFPVHSWVRMCRALVARV